MAKWVVPQRKRRKCINVMNLFGFPEYGDPPNIKINETKNIMQYIPARLMRLDENVQRREGRLLAIENSLTNHADDIG